MTSYGILNYSNQKLKVNFSRQQSIQALILDVSLNFWSKLKQRLSILQMCLYHTHTVTHCQQKPYYWSVNQKTTNWWWQSHLFHYLHFFFTSKYYLTKIYKDQQGKNNNRKYLTAYYPLNKWAFVNNIYRYFTSYSFTRILKAVNTALSDRCFHPEISWSTMSPHLSSRFLETGRNPYANTRPPPLTVFSQRCLHC